MAEQAKQTQAGGCTRVRHTRSGNEYAVLGHGFTQSSEPMKDMTSVVIYQGMNGMLWVRSISEFEDGRFVPIQRGATTQENLRQLAERVRELEAALRPFARMANFYGQYPNYCPDACPVHADPASTTGPLTVGHLRAARAALAKAEPAGDAGKGSE